jgi:hypothetical protein
MSYKLTKGTGILRLADGVTIPPDPRNVDFQEFLEWKAQGNLEIPADPDPVVPAPPALTPRERFEQRTGITIAQLKALLS